MSDQEGKIDKRIGNDFIKYREFQGRKKEYTPEELLNSANEYFQWCIDNPIKVEEIIKYKEDYERIEVNKLRPYTIQGLCNYLRIVVTTFDNYGKLLKKAETEEDKASAKEYLEVVTYVRQIIYSQKFEGAAVNLFNSAIMVRDLSLVNKESIHEATREQPLFPDAHPDQRDDDGDD